MSDLPPLSDEDIEIVSRVTAEVSGVSVVLLKTWVAAMAAELRARRAADDRQAMSEVIRAELRPQFDPDVWTESEIGDLARRIVDRLLGVRP